MRMLYFHEWNTSTFMHGGDNDGQINKGNLVAVNPDVIAKVVNSGSQPPGAYVKFKRGEALPDLHVLGTVEEMSAAINA